jgi:hypothetical protein
VAISFLPFCLMIPLTFVISNPEGRGPSIVLPWPSKTPATISPLVGLFTCLAV